MKKRYTKILFITLLLSNLKGYGLPIGFGYIKEEIPNIELEIRYYSDNNFLGKKVDGYMADRAILTLEAINALKLVQRDLNKFGLGLKIFDAYRPQKAVDHFVRWGKDLNDTKTKEIYYPTVNKKELFKFGYIATKSGHSRGSTVDLTIIDLKDKNELDMGSGFDFFGKKSWVHYKNITTQQRTNRAFLNSVMTRRGFKAYKKEWWHFSLKNEPYNRYFDFDVE